MPQAFVELDDTEQWIEVLLTNRTRLRVSGHRLKFEYNLSKPVAICSCGWYSIGPQRVGQAKYTRHLAELIASGAADKMSFLGSIEIRSPNLCWKWKGGSFTGGRPTFKTIGPDGIQRRVYAYRFAYQLIHGHLEEHMDVCHRCDRGWCVNPYHLFKGTALDNVTDHLTKGVFNARGIL